MPYVCALEAAAEEKLVGGKARNISRMIGLGVNVPPGFVVTDMAFQAFLESGGLRSLIEKTVVEIEYGGPAEVRRASEEIRECARRSCVPPVLLGQLEAWVKHMDLSWPLIVRSSAVGEDSRSTSFAGQLDSFPDVYSIAGLERALLDCWASCWSERALQYQHTRGTTIERMGVIVQAQVQPRVAGVLFTVAPGAPAGPAEMLGEYCGGLAEDLVGGRINPGRFAIAREEFRFRILAHPNGSAAEGRAEELVGEDVLRTLHRIGLDLEAAMKGPQDIEWLVDAAGIVQIVQARPITAVERPAASPRLTGAGEETPIEVWSNANINENYPDPVTPFLLSVAVEGYYHYFRNLGRASGISKGRILAMEEFLRNIVGAQGGRLYYNLTNIHATLRAAPFGDLLAGYFNVYVGAEEETASAAAAESFLGRRGGRFAQSGELLWIAARAAWEFLFLEKRVAAFERIVEEYADASHPDLLARMSLPELGEALRSFLDIRFRRWKDASLADAASMIGYGLLKGLTGKAFSVRGHSTLHNRLLQGLPELVSGQPVIELWRLSRLVHADPALRELFAGSEDVSILEELRKNGRYQAFLAGLERFLEDWGFRISGELMLTVKSFQEEPEGVIPLLKGYVALDGTSPVALLEQRAEERERETRRFLKTLGRRRLLRVLPWPNEGTVGRQVLKWTQGAIVLRERARLKQSLLYSRCRRVLLRIGEELMERGVFREREDAFFLTYRELDELVAEASMDVDGVRSLVAARREELTRAEGTDLPDTLTIKKGSFATPGQENQEGAGGNGRGAVDALRGTGACGGKVIGPCRVLADVSESGSLAAGDVLVTRQTDPGWAPVFFMVSGLVMERGGMLSHGAIVAREYGIPTVVGVKNATRKIQTGQVVEIDGDEGSVRIVG